jgi:uncharacterized protein
MTASQSFKPSYFNVIADSPAVAVLFNSATGQALDLGGGRRAVIEECFAELERSGTLANAELLNGLAVLGFVVPRDEDEYGRERQRLEANLADTHRLFLTIAPTMQCNMRCSYCFQQHVTRTRTMSADIQRGIVEFARRKIEAEDSRMLVVQWFGGEPLMAYSAIVAMTREFKGICADRGMVYYAEMLTNGTLMTPDIVNALPDLAVRAIQISLDGTPATFAERRRFPLKRAERYHRFLVEHMQHIVESTGSVTVRINVDHRNIEEAKDVVMMFKNAGITDQRIDFRLGFLNTSRGIIDCIPHDCMTHSEFADEEHEFRHFLAEQGFMVFGMPQPTPYPCTAPVRNAYTLDPQGNIGKCVPATGTDQSVIARIHPDDIDRTLAEVAASEEPYGWFVPFADGSACYGCRLLPSCMGSCPKMHEEGATFACALKEGLDDKLAFYCRFHRWRNRLAGQ